MREEARAEARAQVTPEVREEVRRELKAGEKAHEEARLGLPAEDKDGLNEWEWRIVRHKAERVRRVTFVPGQPAVMTGTPGNAWAPSS